MGNTHRKKWTEETIKAELSTLINSKGTLTMPTLREMNISTGDCALSNAVTKSGGVRRWAATLGVPLSHSNTEKGWEGEARAKAILERQGFTVERMSTRHPFDLLVNDVAKVDVKCAKPHTFACGAQAYCYNLEKKFPRATFLCLLRRGEKKAKCLSCPLQT